MSVVLTHPNNGRTLLDSLEKAGARVESHCRSGICGFCRVKLVQGDVEYIDEPLAFLDDDEILPCCCRAKTQTIEIAQVA